MEPQNREDHRITSTAIIYKDDKFLITKRSPHKKAFPNKWTVPGGGLETDDYTKTPKTTADHWYFAIENSLRREIREEVGLEVGKVEYLLDMAFIRPDGTPAIILSYYCPYASGEVVLDADAVEFAWVTYEEAREYDLVDGILGEIEMVDKILKGEDPRTVSFNHAA
ncbi:MAG: NUDIX hydrolase [Candidatus Wolfebacteria bacterium GW2011_GWC2_39_22]|uniref:NUDIX hydrolase n=1 Tax=Candidatus Wolfebacteria bacterium GW2011_GWC2_39_22 TaxID=1619013 RepID=A0A0G0QQ30_9BACT|nr:MAG: NUDIX hydrolase [Candidatus Wolfebacteria bacterium GW2011_GWC2_39_22]